MSTLSRCDAANRTMSALLDSANLDLASTPGLPPVAPVAPAAHAAPPPPAAIPTAQQARVLNGTHTEVFIQVYADRILVIVTQLGRIGCMVSRRASTALMSSALADNHDRCTPGPFPPRL